ncbi:MAG: APC family permease [Actinomycetota bacterium]
MANFLKRLAVGRPLSTYDELHQRISKKIALAVFSSDALSSSAYATDEILLVLILAGSAAVTFAAPVGIAVTVVLSIVILSYIQTVKAYSNGGGAYIVAHENLGVPAGLIAASALLIDYVLTVAVSVAAGLAAVAAAAPAVRDYRVGLALGVVFVITTLNLRGLKESATVFAIPTYGFLIAMAVMIVLGAFKVFTGNITPYPADPVPAEQALTLFLILRAFASGSTALTGVEAISNGVPVFRKPESKNAAQTLLVLGGLLAFLFLGITLLAKEINVDPHLIESGQTVTSQIAARVFGATNFMFYVIQVSTALILFLAANTSFAGFPRLGSILAQDRYLPRALQNRGDRLAFSNGIVILALAASGVLIHYKVDVHKIIPLYVIGVFTSFTLSQSGMVVHWFKEAKKHSEAGKPPLRAWKRSALVNAVGALTTFVVFLIVSATKFRIGAWQVLILIPVVAYGLKQINVHYRHVAKELRTDRTPEEVHMGSVLLVVSRLQGATKALALARALSPVSLKVVALGASEAQLTHLRDGWEQMGINVPIESVGRSLDKVVDMVEGMNAAEDEPVTVILPEPQYLNWIQQVFRNWRSFRLKRAFLFLPNTVLISVPYHPHSEPEPTRLRAPGRLTLVVFVSAVHQATVQAIEYARSLNPSELKAIVIQTHEGEVVSPADEWSEWGIDIPLEIVDSPYRSLMEPMLREVRKLKPNPEDAVGVVVPEFVVGHWWHTFLHNQTAFLIKSALLFEPNVMVINVPYRLGRKKAAAAKS